MIVTLANGEHRRCDNFQTNRECLDAARYVEQGVMATAYRRNASPVHRRGRALESRSAPQAAQARRFTALSLRRPGWVGAADRSVVELGDELVAGALRADGDALALSESLSTPKLVAQLVRVF